MTKDILLLLRPHQWVKNMFVFIPLFFDRRATDWNYIIPSLLAFAAFCLAASCIYCFNDIHDAEADSQHPIKCHRPVASGAVSRTKAYATMAVAGLLSIVVAALSDLWRATSFALTFTIILYMVMNVAYCLRLKHVAILDVFIIAIGFVLRIVAGGVATGIYLSHWVILITFLLALFLALAKRRDDVVMHDASGIKARKNIDRYNMAFLNQAITILAAITIMCYILYTVSDDVVARIGNNYLYTTSVFVLAGIMRYMQLTFVDHKSGSPTKVLLHDRFTQLCVAGWLAVFFIILYL